MPRACGLLLPCDHAGQVHKRHGSVVLWYGGDAYEGLGARYHWNDALQLLDGDGEVVKTKATSSTQLAASIKQQQRPPPAQDVELPVPIVASAPPVLQACITRPAATKWSAQEDAALLGYVYGAAPHY